MEDFVQITSIDTHTCLCPPDIEGVNCEIVIKDLYADNPCVNGGAVRIILVHVLQILLEETVH